MNKSATKVFIQLFTISNVYVAMKDYVNEMLTLDSSFLFWQRIVNLHIVKNFPINSLWTNLTGIAYYYRIVGDVLLNDGTRTDNYIVANSDVP